MRTNYILCVNGTLVSIDHIVSYFISGCNEICVLTTTGVIYTVSEKFDHAETALTHLANTVCADSTVYNGLMKMPK